jgi:WD40 repeat protein
MPAFLSCAIMLRDTSQRETPPSIVAMTIRVPSLLTLARDAMTGISTRLVPSSLHRAAPRRSTANTWRPAKLTTGARFLAVEDKTVVFWNTGGQQVLALQHDSPVQRIDFSPRDGRFLTASADGSIRIWNSDGRQLAEIVVGDRIGVVAFNADGAQLFVATGDSAVRIFNVYSISPDETRRIAASLDIEPLTADERQRFSIWETAPETQPPAAAGSK